MNDDKILTLVNSGQLVLALVLFSIVIIAYLSFKLTQSSRPKGNIK